MKDCANNLELISSLVDGELEGEDARVLLAHINSCPQCKKALDDYLEIRAALSDMENAPAELLSGVVSQAGPAVDRWRRFSRLSLVFAAAAAAIVLFVTGAYQGMFSAGNDQPPDVYLSGAGAPAEDFANWNDGDDARTNLAPEGAAPDDSAAEKSTNRDPLIMTAPSLAAGDSAAPPETPRPLPYEKSYSLYAEARGKLADQTILANYKSSPVPEGVDYFVPSDQIMQVLADLSKAGLETTVYEVFENQSDSAETAVLRIIS